MTHSNSCVCLYIWPPQLRFFFIILFLHDLPPPMYVCTHIDTYIYTYYIFIHTYIHTCKHIYTHKYIHITYTHTHTHTHTPASRGGVYCNWTHITYTHTHTHTHTCFKRTLSLHLRASTSFDCVASSSSTGRVYIKNKQKKIFRLRCQLDLPWLY